MTLRNPNRFVTGLSDVAYVKNVKKVEVHYNDDSIPVTSQTIRETVTENKHEIYTDKFLLNPQNNPSDAK